MNFHPVLNFKRRRRTAKVHGWINDRRAELGLGPIDEIPEGVRESRHRCPVSNAFRPHMADVHQSYTMATVLPSGNWRYFFHPEFVEEWIRDFDANGYAAFGRKR